MGHSQSPRPRPEEQQLDLALRGHSDLEAVSSGKQPGSGPKPLGLGTQGLRVPRATARTHRLPRGPGPSVTPFRKDARRGSRGHGRETQAHCWPPGAGPLRCLQKTHPGQGKRWQLPSLKLGCGRPLGDQRAGCWHARPQAACRPGPRHHSHSRGAPMSAVRRCDPGPPRTPPLSRADTVWGGHGLQAPLLGPGASHCPRCCGEQLVAPTRSQPCQETGEGPCPPGTQP